MICGVKKAAAKMNKRHQEIKENLYSKWISSERYAEFIIQLDDEEVKLATKIGNKRFQNNRKLKTYKSNWGNKKANPQRDIDGALSELATIKWLKENGYEPSKKAFLTVSAGAEEDGFDTDIVFNGDSYSVEIKSTTKPMKAKLILPAHQAKKDKKPDLLILICMIDEKRYCIKGITGFEDVAANYDLSLRKPGYSIEEKYLQKDLVSVIENIKQKNK